MRLQGQRGLGNMQEDEEQMERCRKSAGEARTKEDHRA